MSSGSTKQSNPLSPTDSIGPTTDFARFFTTSARPSSEWAVGPEIEFLGFTRDHLTRMDFDQVQSVIEGFAHQIADLERENGHIIEATLGKAGEQGSRGAGEQRSRGDIEAVKPEPDHPCTEPQSASRPPLLPCAALSGRITLEPGGQIEFSCAAHRSLADVERAVSGFARRLGEIGREQGIIFIAAGFDPLRGIEEQKWIPKRRYEIMRPYLNERGRGAWDMMCRTAAIQVNLDYGDLADLAKKFAVANRLAPIAAAIFSNSPFERGKLSGYKSLRYRAWTETDPDRTGPSPVALEDDFSISRFLDYVARVPMFFIRRDGDYIDFTGRSFEQFIQNGAQHQPIFQDFTDHLSTIFTEARLKPHIEQRSMDCGSLEMVMAAMAFWKGLMYDAEALEDALALAPKLGLEEFARLQLEVARHGLEARVGNTRMADLASNAIELARMGLGRVAPDEARYLDVIEERVTKERICPADILIRNFRGSWNGDARKAVEYLRIE
ncbi:MAG: glutamate-cysteine ligase family protein [Blastocatellia bacterium]|nr:glutamate-cysteine ligase family protein [Blastocatellia bacterium]